LVASAGQHNLVERAVEPDDPGWRLLNTLAGIKRTARAQAFALAVRVAVRVASLGLAHMGSGSDLPAGLRVVGRPPSPTRQD